MSGRPKLSSLHRQGPRRSTRRNTSQRSPAPEFEAEANAAIHNGGTYAESQKLREIEHIACEVDSPKLEDDPPRNGPKWPRRVSKRQTPRCLIDDPLGFITRATAKSDLDKWKGWCEVESEPVCFFQISPILSLSLYISYYSQIIGIARLGHKHVLCLPLTQAFFNVILRHLGVVGIKVQEVFSLDDEMLNFLPLVLPSVECDYER